MNTPIQPPSTPSDVSESASVEAAPSPVQKIAKGCGCVTASGILMLGILMIGNFDAGAWASALTALIIVVLVFNLSGVNGFWEK